MLVVATICIVMSILALIFDVFMIISGMAEILAERRGQSVAPLYIRMGWTTLLLIASGFVLFASIQMRQRRSYALAYAGAVVAAIPCVGPCCLLGIPFGIWALVVLHRPEVRSEFPA